ncbi:MAG TPA: c-type cytochrome [Flavobacteriales bacterium]|nr:c-type cytochrome [Flavobacteriales bacterium]
MIRSKYILTVAAALTLAACTKDPNSPGYEYMPDMYRSSAVEAYVDYHHPDELSAKTPPDGTIPFSTDASKAIFNMPYAYPNTPEGYEAAGLNLKNPIPYSASVVEEGKVIYTKMCMHCHGEKGDGQGQIAMNGKFDGIPSYSGALKTLPEGKMFHTITYGKNMMGPHAGQLNQEERWKVIFWVKALQNGGTYPAPAADTTAAPAAAPGK